MKVLFIYNYQREIPPFMQNVVAIGKGYFDRVIFVTRKLTTDNRSTIIADNVEVLEVHDRCRKTQFIISPIKSIFNSYILLSLIKSRNIKLLKSQLTSLFTSDCLYYTSKKLIKKYISKRIEIYALATWFSSEAITVARINKLYNITKAVSFAHSFEIDPDKNPYVANSFNEFKHKNIDEIHYISNKMKDIYYKTTQELNLAEKYDKTAHLTYLGSIKYYDGICQSSEDNVFRIVTCSGVTPVKRIGLLVEALKDWNSSKIQWTHIGGGPLFDKLNTEVNQLMNSNPYICVKLLGWKTNKEVQQYYAENPVDLFVNVSEAEGLPVSIMEAMSYGIPCLATNVGGTSEIVTNETGLLISKDCMPKQILKGIEEFAYLSDNQKKSFRENAFDVWTKSFNAFTTMSCFFNEMSKS